MLSPIIFFAYNRPEHTRRSLESLAENPEAANSILYIFCDGSKPGADTEMLQRINKVRAIVREKQWCGKVHIAEKETNQGLAASVIAGVTGIVNNYGRCIVLEDDLIVSPFFLKYMNEALDEYAANNSVICIHGYTYPVAEKLPETFFLRGADCWGWATWKRGWDLFEPDGKKLYTQLQETKQHRAFNFNHTYNYVKMLQKQLRGENDSWAIRWYASAFLKDKLTLYPGRSLVKNSGADGLGTHVTPSNSFDVSLSANPVKIGDIPIEENKNATRIFEHYFRKTQTTALQRLLMRLKY
jgi:hypothetical protein